tara:strand:- start:9301 stop:9741 length:441 start_codon:yes stop_codon:yes gene_type:complete
MRIMIISGYFNPLHTGHLDYIDDAKATGNYLVAIVNNDQQVKLKGSTDFLSESARMRIVASLRNVDKAILSIDSDKTVVETLRSQYERYSLDPFVDSITFCNGGDRTKGNSPEEEYCQRVGMKTLYNVGGSKTQSSSKLLDSVGEK